MFHATTPLRRAVFVTLIAASVTLAPFALARVTESHRSPAEDTIEAAMGTLKKNARALKPLLSEKDKAAEALPLVLQIEAAIMSAKDVTPDLVSAIEDQKKQAEELKAYRKAMIAMMSETLKLEEALLDGKMKDAEEAFNKLGKMQKPGHDRFKGD